MIRDNIWNWYSTTFYTRQEGNAAIILINTRWHDADLSGRLLAQEKESQANGDTDYDKWELINFTAVAEKQEANREEGAPLWPDKFSLEQLNRTKKALGPYKWSALYQQNPVDEESQEFKTAWFKKRSLEEVSKLKTRKFLTIDPASAMRDKSDNIGAVLNFIDRENKWNLIAWKLRLNAPDLIDFMFKVYSDYGFEKVGIEQGVYEQVIKPYLEVEMRQRNVFFRVVVLKHEQQAKVLRIRGLIPYYSSGTIYHIEGMCSDLEEELVRFPKGAHDDVADAEAYQIQIAEETTSTVSQQQSAPQEGYYEELGI